MRTRRLAPFSTTLEVGQWIGVCAGICEAQAPSGTKSFAPNTLARAFTRTDPTTGTTPWSVEYPWPTIPAGLYQFACDEQHR